MKCYSTKAFQLEKYVDVKRYKSVFAYLILPTTKQIYSKYSKQCGGFHEYFVFHFDTFKHKNSSFTLCANCFNSTSAAQSDCSLP